MTADLTNWTDGQLDASIERLGESGLRIETREQCLAALEERSRRRTVAEAAARLAAPVEAARIQARAAWEAAGSPGSFDTFFATEQQRFAHEQLERQRAAAVKHMRF